MVLPSGTTRVTPSRCPARGSGIRRREIPGTPAARVPGSRAASGRGSPRSARTTPAPFSAAAAGCRAGCRSEENTSELQSLMRISYAVFCLKKKKTNTRNKSGHRDKAHHAHKKKHLIYEKTNQEQ